MKKENTNLFQKAIRNKQLLEFALGKNEYPVPQSLLTLRHNKQDKRRIDNNNQENEKKYRSKTTIRIYSKQANFAKHIKQKNTKLKEGYIIRAQEKIHFIKATIVDCIDAYQPVGRF